jgi:hypothetical protein
MAWTGDFTAAAISAAVRAGTSTATDAVTEALDRIVQDTPRLRPSCELGPVIQRWPDSAMFVVTPWVTRFWVCPRSPSVC